MFTNFILKLCGVSENEQQQTCLVKKRQKLDMYIRHLVISVHAFTPTKCFVCKFNIMPSTDLRNKISRSMEMSLHLCLCIHSTENKRAFPRFWYAGAPCGPFKKDLRLQNQTEISSKVSHIVL